MTIIMNSSLLSIVFSVSKMNMDQNKLIYNANGLIIFYMRYSIYRFSYFLLEFVGDALAFVDIDTDAFSQHKFHGSRVRQPHHHLKDQVDSLVSRCDTVQVNRVMDG